MTNFILRENDNEILLSQESLPIKIGTDLNSEIVVIGPLSIGIALIIDLIDCLLYTSPSPRDRG